MLMRREIIEGLGKSEHEGHEGKYKRSRVNHGFVTSFGAFVPFVFALSVKLLLAFTI
jgi:hypothetical protein